METYSTPTNSLGMLNSSPLIRAGFRHLSFRLAGSIPQQEVMATAKKGDEKEDEKEGEKDNPRPVPTATTMVSCMIDGDKGLPIGFKLTKTKTSVATAERLMRGLWGKHKASMKLKKCTGRILCRVAGLRVDKLSKGLVCMLSSDRTKPE